jgi:arsenate reductase
MNMKKIYHLGNCDTCQKIIKEVGADKKKIELQDIKTAPISEEQLDQMKALAGSYEALFSRRALKYRSMGLHEQTLTENDYRRLILEEYTFLKRPVALVGNQIFIGNTKAVVEALKNAL